MKNCLKLIGNGLAVSLLITPWILNVRYWGSKPKTAVFLAILQNQWVIFSVRTMFGNQHEM